MAITNKMQDPTFADSYWFIWFFYFIFKANHVFKEEKNNPVKKVVIDEEELDGIEIDGVSNLENLPRTMFIH